MKKVAIVTLTKDFNYGNRLQNYAVEQLLAQKGCEVRTLFNTMWTNYGKTSVVKSYVGIPLLYLRNKEMGIYRQIMALFDRFNYRYIHFGEVYDVDSPMNHIAESYDFFVTGSDQVWNPYWDYIGKNEYLTFANDKKKIALSASFGVSIIPENKKEKITQWLNGLDAISVREYRAAEIVKELTGRVVPVLVDPTMCLLSHEWLKIARRPKGFTLKSFVLMYVLGDMPKECMSSVTTYCESINAELIILKDNKIWNKKPIGPREYLYLIANAKYVITDSFHGSVFSILFHRNLAIFHREGEIENQDMMSRLETLMDKFSLRDCLMLDETFDFKNIKTERWEEIERKLDSYRNEVNQFLASNIKEVKEK